MKKRNQTLKKHLKTPQKASLWWLFTSDGTRRKMWQHFAAGAFFTPPYY
jgi:hypothetical protein